MSDPIQRYREILGITETQYLDYKHQGGLDPEYAKVVDRQFFEAAQKANIPADEFRDILKGSPFIQGQIDRKASSIGLDSYALLMEVRYRNSELKAIQGSVIDKIKETAQSAYKYAAFAEKTLFAVTPLPLNALKSGVQNVVVPVTATFALSRIPGVADVVTNAIHLGGSLTASATHAIAGAALAQFANAATSMLPEGVNKAFALNLPLVGQSMGGMISAASSAVVLGSSDIVGKLVGEVGATVAIGNAIVQGAKAIASKGVSATFSELSAKTAELVNKAQRTVEKTNELYTSITGKVFKMETNGRAPEQLNEAQQQYMDLVKSHPQAVGKSYQELGEAYSSSPDNVASEQNNFVAEAAKELGKSPKEIREIVGASPHIKYDLENGKATQENVDAYLNSFEMDKSQLNGKNSAEVPEEGYVIEVNSAPVAKQEAEQTEPPIKPTVVGDKASEDYGFSIQQMLEQRGIQTDRMIINFDGQQKFKMEKGVESPLTNGLSAKDVELLKQAMSDPDFKGSIKISKGGEVLFQRVGEGPPIIDGRQLYKPAIKIEYQSPAQLLHEQASKGVESQGMRQVNDIALNAFRSNASTEEVLSALKHNETAKGMDEKSLNAIVQGAKGAIALERNPSATQKTADKTPALAR